MLGIAKKARASNETPYNWYGDKHGLFQALVTRNAEEVKGHLEAELQTDNDAPSIPGTLGPKLLELLAGDRAIALNRAAAADSSGQLGETLSWAGREAVFPLLEQVLLRARNEGYHNFERSGAAVGLYLDFLIGDQQIRRVIGRLPRPTMACSKNARSVPCGISVNFWAGQTARNKHRLDNSNGQPCTA
ncbi:TetR/AcrR family transcriptional regulator [Sedimentitalea todarodis]|uniref:TetR/AcrR family transcriptional regulator n=1 Tax=Sedimentitalea todarodis TaxID=1631240 RepID=A0ABU3VH56_9RHOB|nr:TetR/AcrR family transcriptional regulator [Sedimentitalea todarodis]MDU9005320.1 TetR/AcrR family transcriptional regulator [Sedimentitalea todarodis]